MKLTTKGRYAVTAMLDLAVHAGVKPVPLADISQGLGEQLAWARRRLSLEPCGEGDRGGGGAQCHRRKDRYHALSWASQLSEWPALSHARTLVRPQQANPRYLERYHVG